MKALVTSTWTLRLASIAGEAGPPKLWVLVGELAQEPPVHSMISFIAAGDEHMAHPRGVAGMLGAERAGSQEP